MKNTRIAKYTFKLALPLAVAFVMVAAPTSCRAEENMKANVTEDIVQFTFGGLPVDWDNMVGALVVAIKEYPNSKKFRTDWKYNEGGGSGEGAALYDRQSKTLKCYSRDLDGSGVSTALYIYSEVTDEKIQNADADLHDKERREKRIKEERNKYRSSEKTIFDGLLRYGSHVTGGWRYRKWSEKEPSLRG